ncbi:unnamed protein product [Chondrus crispus]|uniref:Uncharacterized protein n=1 Tax=Chondrus crispus TaxID=2769 RepID=R7QFJ6_CHOCR|nr:unnamed protein product [Chondrus crispus]CDF36195.1 unnamed protein product [Chondrus crispus]|eukprot:XP_005716014.1 unnamed protein product [Chondrus crispus]
MDVRKQVRWKVTGPRLFHLFAFKREQFAILSLEFLAQLHAVVPRA